MKSEKMYRIADVVWICNDILRGELPSATEYKQVIMPLVTVKFLCDDWEHPYTVPHDAWSELMVSSVDIKDRLRKIVYEIEEANVELRDVFSTFSFDELSDHALYRIIQQLDSVNLARKESPDPDPLDGTVAQNADLLFEKLALAEGKRGGDFATPKELANLSARLAFTDGKTAYDGAAGIGANMIETARVFRNNGRPIPRLFGQEKNKVTWALCKMNLILHGLYEVEVALGDVLEEPVWIQGDGTRLMKFDSITMNPPFSPKWRGRELAETDRFGRFRYGIPSASYGDTAFIQHAVASLAPNGKAVVVSPHGTLFRAGEEKRIRQIMIEDGLLEAVIGLPKNLFVFTALPCVLLVFNRNKKASDKVLFVDAAEHYSERTRAQNYLRDQDVAQICDAYERLEDVDGYSRLVSIDEIAENDWNLNIARYIQPLEAQTKLGATVISANAFMESDAPKVKLSDIAEEIHRGLPVSKGDFVEADTGTHRVVNLADVNEDGEINFAGLNSVEIHDRRTVAQHELEPGNLLLSSRGTMMKVAVVPSINERLVASGNFLVIRLRSGNDPYFLKAFLESPIGVYLLEANQRGQTVTVLSHKDVREIPVPKIVCEQQKTIGAGFREADETLKRIVQKAEEEHEISYRRLYEEMGITSSTE